MIVEIQSDEGWTIAMEFIADTSEQIFVRPERGTNLIDLLRAGLETVFVPSMTGVCREEPLYAAPATVANFLGQGKPGDVFRNLLYQVSLTENAWEALTATINRLFGAHLKRPMVEGPHIVAEFKNAEKLPWMDIAGAGRGFQQVLLMLAILYVQPDRVLLIDEPAAHIHTGLQDAILRELCSEAEHQHSQLLVATHSQVIAHSAGRRLCVLPTAGGSTLA